MIAAKLRVGIVGANPDRGWGTTVHVPALRALPEEFEISAVCTTRQDSAEETARRFGVARAYGDYRDLVRDPDVDIVAICVKAPSHLGPVMAALEAGKHVYCEWPLAVDAAEARDMLALAERKGVRHIVGLQARGSPVFRRVRDLVGNGYLGRVVSANLHVAISGGGPIRADVAGAYTASRASGATTMTIHGGHSLDAFCFCLGEFRTLFGTVATQFTETTIAETGETIPKDAPDQVVVNGVLENGAVASVHINGGTLAGHGIVFRIHGSEGTLIVRHDGQFGVQMAEVSLWGARAGEALSELTIPADYHALPRGDLSPSSYNVAHLYRQLAEGIRGGADVGPGFDMAPGFDLALKRHLLLEAIDRSSATGERIRF
jgi:predicted dehydrogenase